MALDALDHVGLLASGIDARAELEGAHIQYLESDHRVPRSLYIRDPDRTWSRSQPMKFPPENTSVGKKPA